MNKKILALALFCLLPLRQEAGMTEAEQRKFNAVRSSAESDDYQALAELGVMYAMGIGTERDIGRAVECLQFASMQGVPSARYFMGVCYIRGEGVLKDEIEAYAYWSLAANQHEEARKQLVALNDQFSPVTRKVAKDRVAQLENQLWKSYTDWRDGPGKVKTYEKIKRMAIAGDAESQVAYSHYFLNGEFERKDLRQADAWCRKAADQDCAGAFAELASRYLIGRGVEKNEATAMSHVKRAADLGHNGCQSIIGKRYMDGDGVTKSVIEAYAYLELSGRFGVNELDELRQKMRPDSITEGEKRAAVIQAEINRRLGTK